MHDAALRPSNYSRNLLHVGSGVGVLLLIQYFLSPHTMVIASASFMAFAWFLEGGRRLSPRFNDLLMWMLGVVAHPHERHRVNSSTWFSTALFGLSLAASPMISSVAVMVLGVGDPAAAVVGRRFGRFRLASGRSLEGSLGFVVFGGMAAWITLLVYYPDVALLRGIAVALAAAVAGALAELLTRKLDDNLVIPLAAAVGAGLVALL